MRDGQFILFFQAKQNICDLDNPDLAFDLYCVLYNTDLIVSNEIGREGFP